MWMWKKRKRKKHFVDMDLGMQILFLIFKFRKFIKMYFSPFLFIDNELNFVNLPKALIIIIFILFTNNSVII